MGIQTFHQWLTIRQLRYRCRIIHNARPLALLEDPSVLENLKATAEHNLTRGGLNKIVVIGGVVRVLEALCARKRQGWSDQRSLC